VPVHGGSQSRSYLQALRDNVRGGGKGKGNSKGKGKGKGEGKGNSSVYTQGKQAAKLQGADDVAWEPVGDSLVTPAGDLAHRAVALG